MREIRLFLQFHNPPFPWSQSGISTIHTCGPDSWRDDHGWTVKCQMIKGWWRSVTNWRVDLDPYSKTLHPTATTRPNHRQFDPQIASSVASLLWFDPPGDGSGDGDGGIPLGFHESGRLSVALSRILGNIPSRLDSIQPSPGFFSRDLRGKFASFCFCYSCLWSRSRGQVRCLPDACIWYLHRLVGHRQKVDAATSSAASEPG